MWNNMLFTLVVLCVLAFSITLHSIAGIPTFYEELQNTRRYAESRKTYQKEHQESKAEDNTVAYLQSEEQIIRTKSEILFSSDAYFEPCSLFSTVVSPTQTSKFSFTAGLNACRELCAKKYESKKFGICIPVVGCRCLTRGFTNVLRWFQDVTIDPTKAMEEKIRDTR